jgi:hypothetical protein
MDLTTYGDAWIHYSRWFFNAGGSGNPNDTMFIRLTDGTTTVTLEKIYASSANNSSWVSKSYRVSNYLTPTSTMRLIVEVQDFAPGHLVEGAFDNFIVADSNAIAVNNIDNTDAAVRVYPNPFSGSTTVAYNFNTMNDVQMEIVDLTGRVVATQALNASNGTVEVGDGLVDGVYIVRFTDESGILSQQRIVKTK